MDPLNIPLPSLDKVNQRRIARLVQSILEETVDPETYDGQWVDWNPQALEEEIALRLDYLIDKRAIVKYHIENVVGGYTPSADVYVLPVKASDNIKLSVTVTKDGGEFKEIL